MGTDLQGHTKTALCLSTTASGQMISGGEQGELCLWSPDGQLSERHTYEGEDDITSIVCSKQRQDLIHIAIGSRILALDLNHLGSPLHTFRFNEEEINQLALNEKEEHLAACDDSGNIKLINLFDRRVHKTLRKHTNICSTVCFHPHRRWDLFSAGYDSKLIQWNYSNGRSTCVINMEDLGSHSDESNAYLINPPFVHNLDTNPTSQILACGTESSTVQLFSIAKNNPEYFTTLHGHTKGVSQVHFPSFKPDHLVTGGNDGVLLVWGISTVCGSAISNGSTEGAGASHAAATAPTTTRHTPIATINHGDKINWLTTLCKNDQTFIVVADNSDRVVMYPYPN